MQEESKSKQIIINYPFQLKDKINLILHKELNIVSTHEYIIEDILATHSLKSGEITFKIKSKDHFGRLLNEWDADSVNLVNSNCNENINKLEEDNTMCKRAVCVNLGNGRIMSEELVIGNSYEILDNFLDRKLLLENELKVQTYYDKNSFIVLN